MTCSSHQRRPISPGQASVDLFAPSQTTDNDTYEEDLDLSGLETNTVNPFLMAKLKKENALARGGGGGGVKKTTQQLSSSGDSKGGGNPFAKKASQSLVPSSQSPSATATGSIRSGLVFDDMSRKDVGGQSAKPKFGSGIGSSSLKPSRSSH